MKLQYAVVYERAPNNYCAYAPDVPGCVSAGGDWDEIQTNIREALAFHIEGLMMDDDPVPEPRMSVEDAMAYHNEVLAEIGIPAPEPDTTVGMVEVDVEVRHAILEGTA